MKIIIEIDTRIKAAKSFLEFIRNLSFIKKIEYTDDTENPSKLLQKAITDVKRKKTIKMDGNDELSKLLNDNEK